MFQIIKRNYRIAEVCFLVGWLLLLSSCNSKVEGCLDISAENFDLDADKPCDKCCRYPSVSLVLTQRWNDNNFQTTDTLYDVNQLPYLITDLKYVLSSFSWQDSDNLLYTIDSSVVSCGVQQVHYTRDLLQIDSRKFTYELDTIRLFPHVQSINWKLGWPPELQCVDETDDDLPIVFRNTNPLWDPETEQRAAVRIVVQLNTAIPDLDTIFIHTCRQLQLPYDLDMPVGVDASFGLTVDYAKWFISVNRNDPGSFETSVLENIEESFVKTE